MSALLLDLVVVGAGLAGLQRARRALAAGLAVQLVERAAQPGGSARTLRSEGFACEPGPFAIGVDEWNVRCRDLARAPTRVGRSESARTGWIWNGTALLPTTVDGEPCSGATGIEDLVVAYRRELGAALRLGREVTALRPQADGWSLDLGGEVPATLVARAVALCTPLDAAARLCSLLDPALGAVAARVRRAPRALAFFGTWQDQAAAATLRGFGVLVEAPGPVRELLFCSNTFLRRAAAGKALVRVEVLGDDAAGDDDAIAALAEHELRRITGWTGAVLFRRVCRDDVLVRDGAHAECVVRLKDLARRAPGLLWSPD